jgi:hypothetical protein
MPSAVSGPSFSKADILPALKALAWSSLPMIADQLAQRIFYKKASVNRGTDLTLTGLATCIVVVYFLPSGSPAKIGAPLLYLAYRAALYYWNTAPKPPKAPTQSAPRKPPAQKPAVPIQSHSDSSTAAAATPALRPAGETPFSSTHNASYESPVRSATTLPIPTITFTPASPRADSKSKAPPKPEEREADACPAADKSTSPSDRINAKFQKANSQAKVIQEKAGRLSMEMEKTATAIAVKVKITYLPTKETESDPKEKKPIPKEPEVISATILINSTCIYSFPKNMIPVLQTGMKIKYPITEDTPFCWVSLFLEKTKGSLLPFNYLPTKIFESLDKKITALKIETDEKVFEIEFLKAGTRLVGKCLAKLGKCKRVEPIQSQYAMIPVNFKDDPEGVVSQTMAALTIANCYLKPFEKEPKS